MKLGLDMATIEKVMFQEIELKDIALNLEWLKEEEKEILRRKNVKKGDYQPILEVLLIREPEKPKAYPTKRFKPELINKLRLVSERTEPVDHLPMNVIDQVLGYPNRSPNTRGILFYALNLPREKLIQFMKLTRKSIKEFVVIDEKKVTRAMTILIMIHESMTEKEKFDYWNNIGYNRRNIYEYVKGYRS